MAFSVRDVRAINGLRRAFKRARFSRARRYAIACVCTGQMSLAATVSHRQNVLKARESLSAKRVPRRVCFARVPRQVAAQATWANRGALLALAYDEICRRSWAERSSAGDDSFDIEGVVRAVDTNLLHEAEAVYDRDAEERAASRGGKGGKGGAKAGKGYGKGAKGAAKGKGPPAPPAPASDRGHYGEQRAKKAKYQER